MQQYQETDQKNKNKKLARKEGRECFENQKVKKDQE